MQRCVTICRLYHIEECWENEQLLPEIGDPISHDLTRRPAELMISIDSSIAGFHIEPKFQWEFPDAIHFRTGCRGRSTLPSDDIRIAFQSNSVTVFAAAEPRL